MPKKRLFLIVLATFTALGFVAVFAQLVKAEKGSTAQRQPNQSQLTPELLQKIHPELIKIINQNPDAAQIPLIIEWKRQRNPLLQNENYPLPSQKQARRAAIVFNLIEITQQEVAPLLSELALAQQNGQASDIRSFWISPIIALKAKPNLIFQLASRPDIVQIRPDQRIQVEFEKPDLLENQAASEDYPFNLKLIYADLAEQALGLNGTGVVVASLDTGVDWQHPALIKKYRGYNPHGPAVHAGNWYVVTDEPYVYPGDGHGHGTHTMGIIVGDDGEGNRIGVAPAAKWIAVKLFTNDGYTYESWIHAAFQWIMAPNGNPALAPDIVNNSWGSILGNDTRYRSDVQAIRSAGIFQVFSAGNNGPSSGTIASPASYPEAFAVGAIDSDQLVARFSSRGPSIWNEFKPEVVAPGVSIRSPFPGGGFASASGTSQAAPHVSGLAALLLQANPTLALDDLEEILRSTSKPLEVPHPNNNTGWGLINAYAAGLAVTQSGEMIGNVRSNYGLPIPYPTITITSHGYSGYTQTISISGDENGAFSLALQPTFYDVTASAFGFNSSTKYLVEVITGSITNLLFDLDLLPLGSIYGQVSDVKTNAPLSATLVVENTPLSVQTNPINGAYSLTLPSGNWNVNVQADVHRIGHFSESVTAGQSYLHDVSLTPAPKIILVDSGRWYYDSQVIFYQNMLSDLNYRYTLWPIRNPFGEGGIPADLPTESALSNFDLIIWSAPYDSPGLINMSGVLTQYMSTGGDLIISGQDVAFLDASFESGLPSQPYLTDFIGVWFKSEGNLENLTGMPGSPLHGITISLNTSDSSKSQINPDAAILLDSIMNQTNLVWPDKTIGAVTAKHCQPYRAAWLGFGLEGAGPSSNRTEILQRLIDWSSAPREEIEILTDYDPSPLIGPPASSITGTLNIYNIGTLSDTFDLDVLPGSWAAEITLSTGNTFSTHAELNLASCSNETLTYTIDIPEDAWRNQLDITHLFIQSLSQPGISDTITLSAKTPAPVLFVDDERWYNHEQEYIQILNNINLPYDYIETKGDYTPQVSTLNRYPIVLWTTGYDWYAPLTSVDENQLENYLDQGGRLLLSSQDVLDLRDGSQFVRSRLGVSYAKYEITPTTAIPIPGNQLGIIPEFWGLVYPFKNWSDGVVPTSTSQAVIMDSNLNDMGVLTPGSNWRTAFYSFPIETLDNRPRQTILEKSLLWISLFGESHLATPATASKGDQIPITLTLGIASPYIQNVLKAIVPLIPETTYVPDSIQGPWNYDSSLNALVWEGDLTPGITITLRADLLLTSTIPDNTCLSLFSRFYDQKGLLAIDESQILIDASFISLEKAVSPQQAALNQTIFFTITINNLGSKDTLVIFNETLPAGMSLSPETINPGTGLVNLYDNGFDWQGNLTAFSQDRITFETVIDLLDPGARLKSKTRLDYPGNNRFAWGTVIVPKFVYLPWIGN